MDKVDRQEKERNLANYIHIVGRQFKHNVSGQIVKIDSLGVSQNHQLVETFEIMVVATATTGLKTTQFVEEVNYFLGIYKQIN